MDQPGKVANSARGQLKREKNIPLSPCVPDNLVSRDGFSRPVPRQPAHLHTQGESGNIIQQYYLQHLVLTQQPPPVSPTFWNPNSPSALKTLFD